MRTNDITAEIRDLNLAYLMLAQQMLKSDKASATYRLGISAEVADLLEGLNAAQMIKLASGTMVLARFRFGDAPILQMLTSYTKDTGLPQSNAGIQLDAQPIGEFT